MPQVFHRSANTLSRVSIFGAVFFVGAFLWGLALVNRSDYVTRQNVARQQPVQFSHKHHAGELGIDCRYCHTSVERSSFAGIPPTQTCMNCHSQIWIDSPFLEPVRASWRTNESLTWIRVYDLPQFVYFNHSIHLHKGIGCVSCHGRVDEMNQIWQAATLQMEWCLACHRHPERQVRPRSRVFDLGWEAEDQTALGPRLVDEYEIHRRTDCTTCHR
jgi:Cytochrome c7 and related cytochrome c/Class III cytochrome C family